MANELDQNDEIGFETDVQPATLSNLSPKEATVATPAESSKHFSLDMIMDVSVSLSIEVGRTRMSINELLKLSQGSIIELDRMAGEPLDVLVNGTLVARGEIVVVKEKFGIMLTEVVSPEERVRRLR
ncbi:MAG: flagellar motor switch protein FliN [Moraxellaceae bacterium]|nr:flagellar motor switch protein FliN [Moraxellaceae bacterium]MDZ4296773.1 flagellar motor switch protein FliN [Moraxellaceae bacterium]MDZ4387030.1 flagellar motor switch protein FliN [Moraxellaceae bacterium]